MKKIVALVLCLVLALSLCAVAFADSTKTEYKADGYTVLDVEDNDDVTPDADTFTKTVTAKKVVTEGSTTTTYYADVYEWNGELYYACDKSIADYKLVKGGKVVEYLTAEDLSEGAEALATAFVAAKDEDDMVCGDVYVDSYVIGGKYYPAKGADLAVFNGKFVTYDGDDETPVVEHSWDKAEDKTKGYYTTDTAGNVISVKCDTCGKVFTVVETIAKDYAGAVDYCDYGFVLLGAAAGEAGVESAKTFDAGIAMYVGMSLMAVTGSAVVIGKKKEF